MPPEHKRLEAELQRKTAQLAALREIGRAVNAAWELGATLELITRKTAQVMGMDSCSIYLLDDAGEYLVLQATTGLAREAIGQSRLRPGEGLTGWAAQNERPVAVADAARDPRFKYLPETGESVFQSLLAVPLINQGRGIGAINVQTQRDHVYGDDEVELLSLIADLAAGALEKALLYERMQRQIADLTTLAEVSETVTSPLFLDEMLGLVVDMVARVLPARVCSLMLLDEERQELVLRATSSGSAFYRDRPPLPLGQGIAGLVAQSGEPIVVPDVRRDPRYRDQEIARQEGFTSLLAVPLQVRERVIGVLNCYTELRHTFSAEEQALFVTLANQTALAIENARLVTNAAVVREMHHRIKNNLQNVAMLLRMQLGPDREDKLGKVLTEAINRIQSIAAVHELLSQKGFRLVEVKELLSRVARSVVENRPAGGLEIELSVEGASFDLPSQPATSLALAVNELVQNAVEHAFAGRDRGRIAIALQQEPEQWIVIVDDDGVGLADGPDSNLGLQLVRTLVEEDLRGTVQLSGPAGTRATIRMPREEPCAS